MVPSLQLSTPEELRLRTRWIALLHGRVDLSLAATGGVHGPQEVLKVLLAGADVAQMCSALLQHGPGRLSDTLESLVRWLEEREYDSLRQLIGSVSQQKSRDPAAFERANYVRVLDSYTPPSSVWS